MNTRPSQSLFCNSPWKLGFSMLWMAVFAFFIVYGVAYAAGIWATPVKVVDGITAQYTSLLEVNGNPAISYYDLAGGNLNYVRALDTVGSTWGTPIAIDSMNDVGQFTSMAIVNGNPAISYYSFTNSRLKYVRATDVNGTAWGAPVILDDAGNDGQFTSLKVINGNPAISYFDATNGDLKYVRATDGSGSTWGTPVTVDNSPFIVGEYTSLAVVNGNPAISYYDGLLGDLKYVQATDADGSSWGTPVILDSLNFVGKYTSLLVVNGNPAVSYYDETSSALKYIRATDVDGTSWSSPITVDSSANNVGQFTSLVFVSGRPAISYYDATAQDPKYVRAMDLDGATWDTPGILDDIGNVGQYSSMAIVDGNPAVSYSGSLWFVRSETPTALTLSSFSTHAMIFPASIALMSLALLALLGLVFYRKILRDVRRE